jgi:hypothetical protein
MNTDLIPQRPDDNKNNARLLKPEPLIPFTIDKTLLSLSFHRSLYAWANHLETCIPKVPKPVRWILEKVRGGISRLPPFRSTWLKSIIDPRGSNSAFVKNLRILTPPVKITLLTEQDRDFLSICKYFREGSFVRSEIFIYEVTPAFVHIGPGTICTPDFKVVADSGMDYRHNWLPMKDRIRPLQAIHIAGVCASLFTLWSDNYWHFLFDCLAKVRSLAEVYSSFSLTIIMPDSLTQQQREMVECVVRANWIIRYVPHGTWVHVDRLVVPSFISRRANGYLPAEYYDFLRDSAFSHFGLAPSRPQTDRIYLSRANAKHRRVINEDEVITLLSRYGFRAVLPESLSLRDQVELFSRSEAIVGPHGAALAATVFSGKIKVLILYPNDVPTSFFFTQLRGLGQDHFFLTGGMPGEENDFRVNIPHLENIISHKMALRPR